MQTQPPPSTPAPDARFGFPDAQWTKVDLDLNAQKATHHERNDARALRDQIMMSVLLRSSM